MKEQVINPKHPWLVGVAVAAVGAAYFLLLGSSHHPDPGANLQYDVTVYEELDRIETRYKELPAISLEIENPRALAMHGTDLYIAAKDAVVILGQDRKEKARFAIEGTPNCLAVSNDGKIVLGLRDHIAVLDAAGKPSAVWDSLGAHSFISSVAAPADAVYVADAGNRVVLHYDWKGKIQARIGEKDPARDIPGLEAPSPYLDVAVNPEGDLWVVNPGRLGLERYRENGDIVTSWYHPTLELSGFSGCCNPTQIAFTKKGDLITCEKGLVRVKRYDVTSGEFVELIAGSQLFPRQQSVRDLAVDQDGNILVLDQKINGLRIFTEKGPSDGRTTTAKQT